MMNQLLYNLNRPRTGQGLSWSGLWPPYMYFVRQYFKLHVQLISTCELCPGGDLIIVNWKQMSLIKDQLSLTFACKHDYYHQLLFHLHTLVINDYRFLKSNLTWPASSARDTFPGILIIIISITKWYSDLIEFNMNKSVTLLNQLTFCSIPSGVLPSSLPSSCASMPFNWSRSF